MLFRDFLEALDLPQNTVILLDNVRFHHSKVCKEVAIRKGFELLYVPPYSPWFNPIEGIFSIVKREFYKGSSIDASFDKVTESHCNAFFQKSLNAFERW
jgi:transposase